MAVGLLSSCVLMVLGIFPSIYKMNKGAWNQTEALTLTQEKMDEILSTASFISQTPLSDSPTSLPNCTRQWWGSSDPYGNPDIQQITVQVSWREETRTRTVSLTSLLSP